MFILGFISLVVNNRFYFAILGVHNIGSDIGYIFEEWCSKMRTHIGVGQFLNFFAKFGHLFFIFMFFEI